MVPMTNAFSQCEFASTNEEQNVVKLMKMNKSVLFLADRVVSEWFVRDIKTLGKLNQCDGF